MIEAYPLNWLEFKKEMESLGLTDETEIDYIDVSSLDGKRDNGTSGIKLEFATGSACVWN